MKTPKETEMKQCDTVDPVISSPESSAEASLGNVKIAVSPSNEATQGHVIESDDNNATNEYSAISSLCNICIVSMINATIVFIVAIIFRIEWIEQSEKNKECCVNDSRFDGELVGNCLLTLILLCLPNFGLFIFNVYDIYRNWHPTWKPVNLNDQLSVNNKNENKENRENRENRQNNNMYSNNNDDKIERSMATIYGENEWESAMYQLIYGILMVIMGSLWAVIWSEIDVSNFNDQICCKFVANAPVLDWSLTLFIIDTCLAIWYILVALITIFKNTFLADPNKSKIKKHKHVPIQQTIDD